MRVRRAVLGLAALAVFAGGAAAQPPPGAAACSGCHGAGEAGAVVPPIMGRNANEIAAAMRDFRTGQRAATVMDRIAKGFSDDESQAIASWLAAQR